MPPRNKESKVLAVEVKAESLSQAVMEPSDANGPGEPTERAEPTAPTERAEQMEPNESGESTEPTRLQRGAEPVEPCPDLPLEQRVEAVLLCTDRPLPDAKIAEILGLVPESGGVRKAAQAVAAVHAAIERLNASYNESGRSFRVEAVAGGRQILTLTTLGPLLAKIRAARSDGRLSPAALETLAIVAYRQPILRADIESIRGVACGEVLRTLMDRRLVRIVGRAEELGRPMLYGTTREFLRIFGIARLDELPRTGEMPG